MLRRLRKWGRRHPSVTWSAVVALVLTAAASVLAAVFFHQQETTQRRLADAADTQRRLAVRKSDEALGAKQEAERQRNAVYLNLYYADIRLGPVDWEDGNLARLSRKLLGHLPQKGRDDLRGWEWYYLLSLCHQDERTLMDHQADVSSVAWSPDGRCLASTSSDGTLKVWDATSWRLLQTFRFSRVLKKGVAWSPDSQQLAWGSVADDNAVYVWHVRTNEVKVLRGHTSSVWSVAWSPDGKRLASAGIDGSIRIWEPATDSCRIVLKVAEGAARIINSVAWSPDAKRLAAASISEGVTVWDAESGQVLRRRICGEGSNSVAWSPDGKQLAVGAGKCLLYRTADWTQSAQWDAANGAVNCVAWSPDGSRLASAGTDGLLKVWAPESGACLLTLRGHLHSVLTVAWEPGGRRLASGGMDGYVKIWTVPSPPQPRTLVGRPGATQAIAWCEERDALRSYDAKDGSIALWSVATGQRLGQTPAARGRCGLLSRGGGLAAAHTEDNVGRLLLCDARSGRPIRTVTAASRQSRDLLGSAFSPDASRLALVGGRPMLEILDLRQNEVCFRWDGSWAAAASWSPDGRLVAIAGNGDESDGGTLEWAGWVQVFDSEKRQRILKLRHGTNRVSATAVAWSPDGKRLVSGDATGLAEIWEVPTGRKTGSTHLHAVQIDTLAWSPDGRRVASGGQDQRVCVWDPNTGEELLRFDVHAGVTQLEWSADGRRLAGACADGTIRIWDASTGYDFVHSQEFYTDEFHSQCKQADELIEAGRKDDAVALFKQVVEESKANLGPDHPVTLDRMSVLSWTLGITGQMDGAIALLEQVAEVSKAKLGPDHPRTLTVIHNLAFAYEVIGKFGPAEPLWRDLLERHRRLEGPKSPEAAATLMALGRNLLQQGRPADAEPTLRECLAIWEENKQADLAFDTIDGLADSLETMGEFGPAERLRRDLLERQRRLDGPKTPEVSGALAMLGRNLLNQERYLDAEPILRECLAIRDEKLPDSWLRFNALSMVGGALLGRQKYAEAEPLLLQGYEGMKQRDSQIPSEANVRLTEAAERLVRCYEATNDPEKARAWRRELEGGSKKKAAAVRRRLHGPQCWGTCGWPG